jgi:hypothetical protein
MKDAPFAADAPPVKAARERRGARQLELPLAASGGSGRRSSRSRAPLRSRPSSPSAAELPGERRGPSAADDSSPSSDRAYRRLDERTRRVGLEGIAAARALLERGAHVDATEQSCHGGGRAA